MNVKVVYLSVAIAFALNACGDNKKELSHLSGFNWDSFNKSQIEELINNYGKSSETYNISAPPYVVFDWDNTSIFLDIEEAVLMYQLQHLQFAFTPEQLDTILHLGLDTTVTLQKANISGGKFTINKIATDIVRSYTCLYHNYKFLGNHGQLELDEIKRNPDYDNFVTKLRFLYDAIGETYSDSIAYPWVTYLFTGLDSSQVHEITRETVKWQLEQPISVDTLISPELPNQLSVQVKVTWKNGLRLLPEMQEVYTNFREAGFDVWICSASFVDVVKEISSNPLFGYNNDPSHVLAMELERDENGKILPVFRKGYVQTQGKGKTNTINKFLADSVTGKYGYQPIFIAGDSQGDENMLSDFESLKLGLIINRLKEHYESSVGADNTNIKGVILGKLYKKAASSYGQKQNVKYLIQGRDDNTGRFIPSQKHIKFGTTTGKLFSTD